MLDSGITATDLAAWATALDRIDPPKVDVFGALGYIPTPKQQLFHEATEFDVLFGGSAGPGKSLALLMEGIRCCATYPGLRVGCFRRTFPELEESLLTELAHYDYAAALGARYDRQHHDLRFPNGSVLMFRYAESMVDATRRQGGQYQMLMFDERTLTPPDVIEFLCSRLRSGAPSIPVLGIRSSTNPGGPGHSVVRQRYVDATDHGANVVTDSRGRTVRFIPARLVDNPHINPEYARDLDALPDAMRAAFRDGSWSSFSGQVFVEWSHDKHVVPRFAIPTEWQRYCGLDYGWTAPTAVLWAARDNDGRLWMYRELTMRQTPEREQARKVLDAEHGERVSLRAADPSMWGRAGSALPPASQYDIEGCTLTKA
ncbi:MAG: terminase large subunit domain-containing protein, partial [Mycobacteriales bacterium]